MIRIKVYFFLFIIPFLLIPSAYGELEKGINYDKELLSVNPDGTKTYKWTSHPIRILDGWNGFKEYIKTEDSNIIQIETAHGSVILDKNTCGFSYFKKGHINQNDIPLLTDSIVPLQSIDSIIWNEVTQLTGATCQASWDENTQALKATKTHGVGTIEYRFIFINHAWKTELYVHNTSGLNNRFFGFDQTIDLNRDTIFYGGQQRNLDNFNGTTFDRTWLENNEGNVIDLLNGQHYDFDIAWNNLESVTIYDTGENKSKLVFRFTYNASILLDGSELTLDPTFGPTDTSGEERVRNGASTGAVCTDAGHSYSAAGFYWLVRDSATNDQCVVGYMEWDISSIPSGVTVTDVDLTYDVTAVSNGRDCDWVQVEADADTDPAGDVWDDIVNTGTEYVSSDTNCNSVANDYTIDLGSTADTDLEGDIAGGTFRLGVRAADMSRDGSTHQVSFEDMNELTVVYQTETPADAVTDLVAEDETFTTVDLSWTQPDLGNGTFSGYQINYTTPYGDPDTVIVNDTESSATSYAVSGLSPSTAYSFRVGPWTTAGLNASGNIANVTTLGSAISFGNVSLNATNTNTVQMLFERDDVNSTHTFVNVTYSDSFDLACDLSYKFARTNQTYTNLDNVTVSSGFVESSFIFINSTDDIITFYCWDQTTGYDGRYVVQWSDFPLLDQVNNFRNGTYGTDGQFGALDFITILVIIGSMIGFNRVNESVGIIFSVAFIGVMGFLGVIEWPTILTGIIAVIVVITVVSTRKD